MTSLKEYVETNEQKFIDLSVEQNESLDFFKKNVLAKIRTTENRDSSTLESHTEGALKVLKDYIEENPEVLENFSRRQNIEKDILMDILFFSVFFHDMGKGTHEFYNDKILDIQSSYHPLYSIYFVIDQENLPKIDGVDYVTLAILSHHTVIHQDIYGSDRFKDLPKPSFFQETIEFAEKYRLYYEQFFNKECSYDLNFKISEKVPYRLLREKFGWGNKKGFIDNLNNFLNVADDTTKKKVKEIYGFVTGSLIRADWLSSGSYELDFPEVSKEILIQRLKERSQSKDIKFEGLKEFQEHCSNSEGNLLIKIPTGEGKTEAALLWALKNLKNKHTKIIYTMPTQITSNSIYKRLKTYFGDNVGIVHGASSLVLAEEYAGDEDRIWKEKAINKTFSKPLTVTTLDSFILSFFNVHKWPFAQLNIENCLVIVDEIHSYDWQMLGAFKKILRELKLRNCKVAIMSATFPEILENRVLEELDYKNVTQKELFESQPVIISKNPENIFSSIESILNYFYQGKKVLVVVNTVEASKEVYELLKKTGAFKTHEDYDPESNLLLYHSQFIKKDRRTKEKEIENKENWMNNGLVLISTQMVEISLDIDFEVLFTELAPLDALVQRMGRVNRRKDTEKLGQVFVQTKLNCRNKSGKWSYPYGKEIIEHSEAILTEGNPSLKDFSNWVSELYEKLLGEDKIQFEFENKFNEGFKKYDQVVKRSPYALRFSTDNYDEISKILKLRDVDERFEKIDVIPRVMAEKTDETFDFEKYDNTVGIYKWFFGELMKKGQITEEQPFNLVFLDYNYEYGLKVIENTNEGKIRFLNI